MNKTTTFIGVIALTLSSLVSAQIVGFNDGTTAQTAASTLDANLSSATLDFGSGLIKTETATDDFLVGGDPISTNWNLQDALDNDYYYSLSISPNSGFETDFDSISLYTFSQNDARTFYVFSDLTGSTVSDSLGSYTQSSTTVDAAGTEHIIDLNGSGLDSVSTGIEFRIYFTNQASASTFEDSGFRQPSLGANFVSVGGTVSAIPEPSSLVLITVALGGLVCLRRRK